MKRKGAIHKGRVIGARKLREFLKPIHARLRRAGVPKSRLPDNDAIVSKLLDFVDDEKVQDWIDRYADAMR
jgi:hypothetical protein